MKRYRILFAGRFHKDYLKLPQEIQKKADQQILRLAKGEFSHPSLRAKKMEGEEKVWEASVTKNYRLVFKLEYDLISFLKIGAHDIL
ncbi:MAG: hypothetical protein HYU63_08425 [Armatimonadetes bacterium]|nr:hypothetical protein [Armatimonadota bacterium]